jgi:hypothetical protein
MIGAVAFSAWSWLSSRVRSATAERRAISSARSAVRTPRPRDLHDGAPRALQMLAKPRAPAAGALDAKHDLLGLGRALGPLLQFDIAGRAGLERALAKQLAEQVQRHRIVALLVGIDADCDHRLLLLIVWSDVCDVDAAGQSCVE